jgi:hypothetical protein
MDAAPVHRGGFIFRRRPILTNVTITDSCKKK